MEIKATLNKPYTKEEEINFMAFYGQNCKQQNPECYEIRRTSTALEAWGKTPEEQLTDAKQSKYQEASSKAKSYLESGEACFVFTQGENDYHIEATDGNIAKMNAYLTGLQAGTFEEVTWVSKEDEILTLNAEDVTTILLGLGQVQADVWSNQFLAYKNAIDEATTVEEINAIEINYNNPV